MTQKYEHIKLHKIIMLIFVNRNKGKVITPVTNVTRKNKNNQIK